MPAKKAKAKEHIHYHKDGTIWAKGELTDGVMTGYWEWFRKATTVGARPDRGARLPTTSYPS